MFVEPVASSFDNTNAAIPAANKLNPANIAPNGFANIIPYNTVKAGTTRVIIVFPITNNTESKVAIPVAVLPIIIRTGPMAATISPQTTILSF